MGRRIAMLLAALAAAPLAAKAPPPPLTLEPSSAWNMHYADDSCRLLRSFGQGEQETVFYAEQFAPTTSFVALVSGKPLAGIAAWNSTLAFTSGARAEDPTVGTFDKFGPSVLFTNASLDPADNQSVQKRAERMAEESDQADRPLSPAQEAAVTWVELRRGAKAVRLDLGPMDKPMAALRKCTDELVEHWGIDAEAQRHLTRKATPASAPGTWISSEEYPSNLLARGVQGLVQFRMIVDAHGQPTSCTIQQSTRPVEFDETVCRVLMRRARFEPALDAQGKPITSYWRSTVHFIIG